MSDCQNGYRFSCRERSIRSSREGSGAAQTTDPTLLPPYKVKRVLRHQGRRTSAHKGRASADQGKRRAGVATSEHDIYPIPVLAARGTSWARRDPASRPVRRRGERCASGLRDRGPRGASERGIMFSPRGECTLPMVLAVNARCFLCWHTPSPVPARHWGRVGRAGVSSIVRRLMLWVSNPLKTTP